MKTQKMSKNTTMIDGMTEEFKAAVELKADVEYLNALYKLRASREMKGRDTQEIDQEITELRAEITKLRHKSNI